MRQQKQAMWGCIVLMLFLLGGCGEKNPLLGTWEGKIEAKNATGEMALAFIKVPTRTSDGKPIITVIFKEKEVIYHFGQQETAIPVIYKTDENGVAYSEDNGSTWLRPTFKDNEKNFMSFSNNHLIFSLRRLSGEKSPLLGTWEGKIEAKNAAGEKALGDGKPITFVFKEKELIDPFGERLPVIYKKDENGYAFSLDNGDRWLRTTFSNNEKNVMSFSNNHLIFSLKRLK